MSYSLATRPFEFDRAPDSMLVERRWICWRLEDRGRPKPDKVPYQAKTGVNAKSNTPDTWGTWREAVDGWRRWNMTGISFALGGDWIGVDVDHAVDNGVLSPLAQSVVADLGGYAEISPSGTGLHVIVRGEMPGEHGRKKNQVEMYGNKRFFTFTGWFLGGDQKTADGDRVPPPEPAHRTPDELKAFYDLHFPLVVKEENRATTVPGYGLGLANFGNVRGGQFDGTAFDPAMLSDEELIRKILASKNGGKFEALYQGDWRTMYTSQSEADAALCGILSWWCAKDANRIDRLFRQSRLMRPKWLERRGAETYGQRTIRMVI